MKVTERFKPNLPEDIDKESTKEEQRQQKIKALYKSFRECVKSKRVTEKNLENVIQSLSIKDINDIFFDDPVPNLSGRHYNDLIEEFLSGPDFYKKEIGVIIDGYLSIVIDLQERVQKLILDGKTDEGDPYYRTSTATYLDARLTSICERTRLILAVYENVGQLQAQLGDMQSSFDELTKEVTATSTQIMPNIISLMGVFSSVIVVILSLITTSSTWLSNADEISVLIAFIVPAGIITLAICALTALVRAILDAQSNRNNEQSDNTNPWWSKLLAVIKRMLQRWGLWLFIATTTVLIVFGTTSFCQKAADDQVHYILKCQPILEAINDFSDEEAQITSEVSEQELFIVQEIILPTGELYLERISCTESDKHSDGFVYYCLLHQCFE